MQDLLNTIHKGDCLDLHPLITSGAADLILTDLPYGVIQMKESAGNYKILNAAETWDNVIAPQKIYEIANRILRKNGKLILFSQEPYTTELIKHTIPNVPFCYRAIWEKDNFAVSLGVNRNMVSFFEDILIFNQRFDDALTNPVRPILKQIQEEKNVYFNDFAVANLYLSSGIASNIESAKTIAKHKLDWNYKQIEPINKIHYDLLSTIYKFPISFDELDAINKRHTNSTFNLWEGNKYKSNILKYKKDYDGYHPTQKPILLLEDLIKTFSNEGDLVVDLTAGSGSTAIAALKTKRNFICIEKEEKYVDISRKRVSEFLQKPELF
jgi:site-specific DNA-methyltransferase (adenine-specific)